MIGEKENVLFYWSRGQQLCDRNCSLTLYPIPDSNWLKVTASFYKILNILISKKDCSYINEYILFLSTSN